MILLVEDDRKLGQMVCDFLNSQNLDVHWLRDGDGVLDYVTQHKPELVILDWMLPVMSGIELCQQIKSQQAELPVLLLTARQTAADELEGLKTGADDYVRKPFDPDILLARIQNLLRRRTPPEAQASQIILGELTLEHSSKRALLKDQSLAMTSSEFDLLWLLASHQDQVVSRDQVFAELRGLDYDGVDRLADVRVWRLRKKLEQLGLEYLEIRSVRGQGYVLSCSPGVAAS